VLFRSLDVLRVRVDQRRPDRAHRQAGQLRAGLDQVPGYAVALVKAGAKLSGLAMGPVRPPLVDAYPEHVEQLEAILRQGRAVLP